MIIYSKPTCKVKELQVESLMQTLSYSDSIHPDKDTEVLTRGRRGTWGSLWYDGDDEGNR